MRTSLIVASLVASVACSGSAETDQALVLFTATPPAEDFYALPFPNDIYRGSDGKLQLSAFPTRSTLVAQYRDAAAQLDGFGLNQAVFFRVTDELDPASLPSPAESMTANASVYLLATPDTPSATPVRVPIVATYRAEAGLTIAGKALVVRPYPGFPLAEGTRYAVVVTNRVQTRAGRALGASDEFIALRDATPSADAALAAVYAPLWATLAPAARQEAIGATVFTTQHISQYPRGLAQAVAATSIGPITGITRGAIQNGYTIFEGTYDAPNFQRGEVPYRAAGGNIEFDSNGLARVQRMEPMRFAMTLPNQPMPQSGFPFVIVQHGTGGDYRSAIADGTATRFAAQGIATFTTDQVLHGPRNPGGNPEIDFYNFGNPDAVRDNILQGTADGLSLLRIITGLRVTDGERAVTFDANRALFFGHSQGAQTGPGVIACAPKLAGAVLSGAGGVLYLGLLEKTDPLDIPTLLTGLLRDDPITPDNPSLALLQMFMERADPVNHARWLRTSPCRAEAAPLPPRPIFVTEGYGDTYTPNAATDAFATALEADPVAAPQARAVPGLALRNRAQRQPPFAGYASDDLTTADLTLAFAQYQPAARDNGHFVVFDVPAARTQSVQFLTSLVQTGKATVVEP